MKDRGHLISTWEKQAFTRKREESPNTVVKAKVIEKLYHTI
ncbi:hypothetical protein ASZ90_019069 [hydrocarbon metagenome]|uniref:Uncharacterized protein n=1 Tax=hydrocarbon metagenome TaxID=938273 RepID=A0A0W8E576_9ZZZZ